MLVDFIERALLACAAVILSFMGAVHWGLSERSHREVIDLQLGLFVIPALLAWVVLMLPVVAAHPPFILSFIVL